MVYVKKKITRNLTRLDYQGGALGGFALLYSLQVAFRQIAPLDRLQMAIYPPFPPESAP
jgi:hypothetical protein